MMKQRLAVIGSGGGGLGAALLAQASGVETDLYEAHRYPGGCASWFQRGPFVFDVGATTLSGIGANRPLSQWAQTTGAPLKVFDADPGIVFHLPQAKLYRYRDLSAWLRELERVFPHQPHEKIWRKLHELSEQSWKFLPALQGFPPRRWSDLWHIFSWLKGVKLTPYLMFSLETFFQLHSQNTPEFKRFIDALCMISAQNKASQVPALIGALAMTYPAETYAPKGGMKGLFSGWLEHFQSLGGHWKPNQRVTTLTPSIGSWEIGLNSELSRESYQHVVSNMTGWSLSELLCERATLPTKAWSAFTIYAGVKAAASIKELYHLVLPQSSLGVPDYFCSFSHPEDSSRAPEGWQTVTISIHTTEDEWDLSGEAYAEKKEQYKNLIWQHFKQTFPQISAEKFLTAGTPKTFYHYTLRPGGRVGGLPHRWSYPLWLWPSQFKREGLSQLGDTVFPGQGLVATITGSMQWWREKRTKLF